MKKNLLIFVVIVLGVAKGYSQTTEEFLSALKGAKIVFCRIESVGSPFLTKTVKLLAKEGSLFRSITISSKQFLEEQTSGAFEYSEWEDTTGAIRILMRKKVEEKQGTPLIRKLDHILQTAHPGTLRSVISSMDLTNYAIKSCDSIKATNKDFGFRKKEKSDKKLMRVIVLKLKNPNQEILLFSNIFIKGQTDVKKINKIRITLGGDEIKIIRRIQLKTISPKLLEELDIIIQLRDA